MTKPNAYKGDEPFAFVAYSHSDESRVHDELNWLNANGFRTFYDDGIHPGHRWREDIAAAIDRAHVFVFFVTPRSVQSEDCLRELDYALGEGTSVLAVHLEETELPSGVKLSISDRQAIMGFEFPIEEYRSRLMEALGEYLDPQSGALELSPADSRPITVQRKRVPVVLAVALGLAAMAATLWLSDDPIEQGESPTLVAEGEAFSLLRQAELLVDDDRYGEAFSIMRRIGEPLGDHPDFVRLEMDIVQNVEPRIATEGARVAFRPLYPGVDFEWIDAGTTPIGKIAVPRGVVEFRLEKSGFQTSNFVVANPGPLLGNDFDWDGVEVYPSMELVHLEEAATDYVHIPAADLPVVLQGTPQGPEGSRTINLPAYGIARAEVTNREYKEFVDAGGYEKPSYWQGLAFQDGTNFSLDEFGKLFVDTTGRSGPAGWEVGTFPTGTADHPVGGLSWFEAKAYANFRNAALPTAYHWARAAQGPMEAAYATVGVTAVLGNFNSSEVRPADARALSPWGAYDMAGNVREWVENPTSVGRLSLGGSYNDYEAIYFFAASLRELDRSRENGLRLMRESTQALAGADERITLIVDSEPSTREPVSDEVFEGLRMGFVARNKVPADTVVEVLEDSSERRIEEVTLHFDNQDPFTMYLGLPKPVPKSIQSVIYMTHGGGFLVGRSPNRSAIEDFDGYLDFIIRSGRAVVIPIWSGSRERFDEEKSPFEWYQDLNTTIEYLNTRDRFEEKIAFFGFSFGALRGPPLLAVDERLATGVLVSGGIMLFEELEPAMDTINFAPRITQPVLLVNGRFDPIVPYGESQQRLLNLLPNDENQHVVFDDLGHWGFPRHRFYRTVVDWLDNQLGPVRR